MFLSTTEIEYIKFNLNGVDIVITWIFFMTTGGVKGLDVISDWSIVKTDLTTSGNPEQLFTLVNRIPFFLTPLLFLQRSKILVT